jgi:hypothetical protein
LVSKKKNTKEEKIESGLQRKEKSVWDWEKVSVENWWRWECLNESWERIWKNNCVAK